MIRKFYLIDKTTGKGFDLNNIRKAYLINPAGLGFEFNAGYTRVGHRFVQNYKHDKQVPFEGTIVCASNKPYRDMGEFFDYIRGMKEPTILYKTDGGEFYKDMDIISLEKTEISEGALQCPITFMPKSLWYDETVFSVESGQNIQGGKKYEYEYAYMYNDVSSKVIHLLNRGSEGAEFAVDIEGPISNPYIQVVKNNETLNEIRITAEIDTDETFRYSAIDSQLYAYVDGETRRNLFEGFTIGSGQSNFFDIPQGDVYLIVGASNEIRNAKFKIQRYYRVV